MKKTIIILLLLLSSIAFSQRKTVTNKLQILDLKNAKVLGLDSKGNAYDNGDYVQEKIDNLNIGSRNYLENSRYRDINITDTSIEFFNIFEISTIRDMDMILSFMIKSSVNGNRAYVSFGKGASTRQLLLEMPPLTTEWEEINIPVRIVRDDITHLIIVSGTGYKPEMNGGNVGSLFVKNISLRVGNKVMGWSPAPEDQVSDWAETNTSAFSYIKNKPTKLSQFSKDIYFGNINRVNAYSLYPGGDVNMVDGVRQGVYATRVHLTENTPVSSSGVIYNFCSGASSSNYYTQISTHVNPDPSSARMFIRQGRQSDFVSGASVWREVYTNGNLTKLSQLKADNIYTKTQSDARYMPLWDKDYNDLINKPTNLVTEQRLTDSISKVRAVTYLNAGHKIALSDADTRHINNKPLQSTDMIETGSPNGGYLMRVNGDGYANPSEIYIDKGHISIGVKDDENNVSKLDIRGGKVELKNFDVGGANNGSISVSKEGVDVAGNIMERVIVSNDTIIGVGKHLTVPEGVRVIKGGYNLSVGFKNLTSIQFPISLEEIGEKSFYGSSLKSVALKDVKKVGAQAFYGCAGLTTVNLGDKLEVIETLAFGYCEKIKEVIFPSTLTSIGAGAFDTSAIKNINLPAGCHYKATSFYKWEENGVNYPIITGGVLDD